MLSCTEILTTFQVQEEGFAPKDFDFEELKYVLNLFRLNNVNSTSVYQIIEENINLVRAKGL